MVKEWNMIWRGGGKETLRGQQQIPSKNWPKYPYCPFQPPPPPQECIELHVQEWSDRSNVFPLVLLLSPWQSIHISGTSSKLGRNIAFHHCTLLLDVDEVLLKSLLHPSYVSFFNPLPSNVNMHILHSVLYESHMVLTRRI